MCDCGCAATFTCLHALRLSNESSSNALGAHRGPAVLALVRVPALVRAPPWAGEVGLLGSGRCGESSEETVCLQIISTHGNE